MLSLCVKNIFSIMSNSELSGLKFFFNFYWSIVDLQCCISIQHLQCCIKLYSKVNQLYIYIYLFYIYIYIYVSTIFFKYLFFSHIGNYRILLLLLFSRSVMSDSLQTHGLQYDMLPCPSPSPGVCSNSCPLT